MVVVSISVVSLILISFFGLQNIDAALLTPFMTDGNTGLISTIAFVYISYAGVTKVAAIAGEIKNPSKNLPLAMILSLVIIATIYVFISFVLVGNIPLNQLSVDIKPIYTVTTILAGEQIGYVVAIIGVITLMSMANSGVLASSRFPFAMARDLLMPTVFSKIHSKHLTPKSDI